MKPGAAREVLKRLQDNRHEEMKAEMDHTQAQAKAVLDGMGAIIRAVDNQSRLLKGLLGRGGPWG